MAEQSRTVYGDMDNPNLASDWLPDYATADELSVVIYKLKQSYSEYGVTLRDAKNSRAAFLSKRRKTRKDRESQYLSLFKEQHIRYQSVCDAEEKRRQLNTAIKILRTNEIPPCLEDGGFLPEVAEIRSSYKAADGAAHQAWEEEVAKTPIDDAAWQEELQWRKKMDEYFSDDSERFL